MERTEDRFCINTLCLNIASNNAIDVENYLDSTINFFGEKWTNYNRINNLYLYADFCQNNDRLFNIKEYFRKVLSLSKGRDFAMLLANISKTVPYYEKINDNDLSDVAQKNIWLHSSEPKVSDAQIFYFAHKTNGYILSLPLKQSWKCDQIEFNAGETLKTSKLIRVENYYVDDDTSKNRIERKFFPDFIYNVSKFKSIGKKCQGQPIFKEIATGNYWYLDNLHKHHYEVFSSNGREHLGEADLSGNFDASKAKLGRDIVDLL